MMLLMSSMLVVQLFVLYHINHMYVFLVPCSL
jgi:hypothetical protein